MRYLLVFLVLKTTGCDSAIGSIVGVEEGVTGDSVRMEDGSIFDAPGESWPSLRVPEQLHAIKSWCWEAVVGRGSGKLG